MNLNYRAYADVRACVSNNNNQSINKFIRNPIDRFKNNWFHSEMDKYFFRHSVEHSPLDSSLFYLHVRRNVFAFLAMWACEEFDLAKCTVYSKRAIDSNKIQIFAQCQSTKQWSTFCWFPRYSKWPPNQPMEFPKSIGWWKQRWCDTYHVSVPLFSISF